MERQSSLRGHLQELAKAQVSAPGLDIDSSEADANQQWSLPERRPKI